MVFQGESSRSNISLAPRNWFSRKKFRQPKNTVRRVAACGSFRVKYDSPILKTMTGSNSGSSMDESDVLKKKIKRIEKQNCAQQRRLQQLEKLVMQLSHNLPLQALPCLSVDKPPTNQGIISHVRKEAARLSSQAECEDQDSDCQTDGGDGLTKDLASLMEEFDRNGRENGMVYGVTPSHSFADSDDLVPAEGTGKMPLSTEDVTKAVSLAADVSPSPLPIFITPTYENWTKDKNKVSSSLDAKEPESSPQPCFTTPVLLTLGALKQAEQSLNVEDKISRFGLERWSASVSAPHVTQPGDDDLVVASSKTNPFCNLQAWINHTPSACAKHDRPSEKGYWPAVPQSTSQSIKGPPGFCSPSSSSVGSASEQVHKWSQSLRLPLLSPMPESLCSEQDANVSPAHKSCNAVKF